jgi:hypothetical protein
MNAIIDLLNAKGYKNTGDNRSFDIRSINSLIDLGVLSFDFIEADLYNREVDGRSFWFNATDGKKRCTAYMVTLFGKRYYGHFIAKSNVRVMWGEKFSERNNNYTLSIGDILIRISRLISINKEGVDFMQSQAFAANGKCSCNKCNGTGNIPAFAHYANGICFDCGGVGIDRNVLKSMINNSLSLAK